MKSKIVKNKIASSEHQIPTRPELVAGQINIKSQLFNEPNIWDFEFRSLRFICYLYFVIWDLILSLPQIY